jgi:integrase
MYDVREYLGMLKLAKRSKNTISTYRKVLLSYSMFLDVPLDDVHNHLIPENLIKYAASRADRAERGTQLHLTVLHRYFELNGIRFDPLERNVLKAHRREDRDDKPLDLETLQRMMDLGTPQTRAILSTLISTGMRAGECCRILLSDVKGDVIHIRPEIAKGRKGGNVYLTAEAQEYLDIWLKNRTEFIRVARSRNFGRSIPENDSRLFVMAYDTLLKKFSRLYDHVDGEQGRYRGKITPHSTRRYFRTHAVTTMPLDIVEKIMRHSGYLTDSYVRISEEDTRKTFHKGESSLYITRKDNRASQQIAREQAEKLATVERRLKAMELILKKVQK